MSKIKKDISNYYQDYFDKNLSERDPDLYNSINEELNRQQQHICLLYTSPSPRDLSTSRMPSSA